MVVRLSSSGEDVNKLLTSCWELYLKAIPEREGPYTPNRVYSITVVRLVYMYGSWRFLRWMFHPAEQRNLYLAKEVAMGQVDIRSASMINMATASGRGGV